MSLQGEANLIAKQMRIPCRLSHHGATNYLCSVSHRVHGHNQVVRSRLGVVLGGCDGSIVLPSPKARLHEVMRNTLMTRGQGSPFVCAPKPVGKQERRSVSFQKAAIAKVVEHELTELEVILDLRDDRMRNRRRARRGTPVPAPIVRRRRWASEQTMDIVHDRIRYSQYVPVPLMAIYLRVERVSGPFDLIENLNDSLREMEPRKMLERVSRRHCGDRRHEAIELSSIWGEIVRILGWPFDSMLKNAAALLDRGSLSVRNLQVARPRRQAPLRSQHNERDDQPSADAYNQIRSERRKIPPALEPSFRLGPHNTGK